MKVKALISFTTDDLSLSLRMGEVAEIANNLANELIADGYVEEYSDGGGDYSTATMTIVNRVYNSWSGVDIPYLHDAVELPDGDSQPFIDVGLYAEGASESQEEVTVVGDVLLRNGYELAKITSVNHIEVSGDANLISLGGEDYLLEVTGDCTITFTFS